MRISDWSSTCALPICRSLGIDDDVPAIAFLGRLVMEKGLDVFADAIDVLQRRGVPHKVVVIGEGPAREWFESRLPDANFVGFQGGADLAPALASSDIFFNPSVTQTFGRSEQRRVGKGWVSTFRSRWATEN